MRINRAIVPLGMILSSLTSLCFASWQYNTDAELYNTNNVRITNKWMFNITADTKGDVYNGDTYIGKIEYLPTVHDNQLVGGSVTTEFSMNNDGTTSVDSYYASRVGSNWNLFDTTDVYINMPQSIYNDKTDTRYPITGVDHLATYTTVGGLITRRYLYYYIPEGYEFIGNYAFYLIGSEHSDTFMEFDIPSTVSYIGHEAFNFSTLNHKKNMNDQKYKFVVKYAGTAEQFLDLIENSKNRYNEEFYGYKKEEMEDLASSFMDDGIIYSGSKEYSWFFRPLGQKLNSGNDDEWPAQTDFIDVYCATNPNTGKKEIVRFLANSPIEDNCKKQIKNYKTPSSVEGNYPQIIEIA